MTAWVARVDVLGLGFSVLSSSNEVVSGDLSNEFGAELEELATPGVNGQRFRQRRRVFKPLVLRLVEDFTSETTSLAREDDYQRAEGQLARLAVVIGAVVKRWDRCTIELVTIVTRGGPLIGAGAKSGSKYTLVSEWTFRRAKRGDSRT